MAIAIRGKTVEALTLNGGTADVVLPGAAPLPQFGTITPTVAP